VAGLQGVIGPLWERFRGSRAMRQSRGMREFYSALVKKDALVFDIGANVGTMTRVFASLGARVVAVEANPDCARHIELSSRRDRVEVLQTAVGDRNGLGILKISDRKDKMSSLSDEWREAVSKENRDYAGMWKRELTVPMITLDALIARYQMPDYIKLDIEGYEELAIQGLSVCPPILSFEFNRLFLESTLRALDSKSFRHATFNYTLIDPVKFELDEWVGQEELKRRLLDLGNGPGLGDIFARSGG
jgi:FkbM family methyltransferase